MKTIEIVASLLKDNKNNKIKYIHCDINDIGMYLNLRIKEGEETYLRLFSIPVIHSNKPYLSFYEN